MRVNPSLAELNLTKAIAVYVECEFHDTKEGADWIINNVKSLGEAICRGVCNYYGVTYKENSDKLYRVQIGHLEKNQTPKTVYRKQRTPDIMLCFIAILTGLTIIFIKTNFCLNTIYGLHSGP